LGFLRFKLSYDAFNIYNLLSLTILDKNSQKLSNTFIIGINLGESNFQKIKNYFQQINEEIKKVKLKHENMEIIFVSDLKAFYSLYNIRVFF